MEWPWESHGQGKQWNWIIMHKLQQIKFSCDQVVSFLCCVQIQNFCPEMSFTVWRMIKVLVNFFLGWGCREVISWSPSRSVQYVYSIWVTVCCLCLDCYWRDGSFQAGIRQSTAVYLLWRCDHAPRGFLVPLPCSLFLWIHKQ